jgi:hypothetical protein
MRRGQEAIATLARAKLILTPIVHTDSETAGDMVLQMTGLTAFGIYDWLYTSGHFHPGCSMARPNVTPPNVTSCSSPLSNERFSSGTEKVLFSIFGMRASLNISNGRGKDERSRSMVSLILFY